MVGYITSTLYVHCKLLQIDYRQTKFFVCKLLDFCYNCRQILAKTTALQTNDCRYNSWLYLDFEHRQTSVFSTVKTFAVNVIVKASNTSLVTYNSVPPTFVISSIKSQQKWITVRASLKGALDQWAPPLRNQAKKHLYIIFMC